MDKGIVQLSVQCPEVKYTFSGGFRSKLTCFIHKGLEYSQHSINDCYFFALTLTIHVQTMEWCIKKCEYKNSAFKITSTWRRCVAVPWCPVNEECDWQCTPSPYNPVVMGLKKHLRCSYFKIAIHFLLWTNKSAITNPCIQINTVQCMDISLALFR